jgi:arabinogalactan endo-1,4-beta-galactosidase
MHTRIQRVAFCVSVLTLASACGTSSSGSTTDGDAGADATGTFSPDSGVSTGSLDGSLADASSAPPLDAGSADAVSAVDGGAGEAASSGPADAATLDATVVGTGADATTSAEASVDATTQPEAGVDAAKPVDAALDATKAEAGVDATAPADSGPEAASPDAAVASYYLGADVSFVQQEEAEGRKFYDVNGTEGDIFQILKNHGFNYVRLRTFVNPTATDGYDTAMSATTPAYCSTANTVTMAARVKAAGMGLLIDFHYSDNWADPGKQCVPVAWQGYTTITDLAGALQTYTNSVITALVAGNARPDMVQIGNEITPGMLLDICDSTGAPTTAKPLVTGSNSTNFDNLGALLNAGIAGVKAVDSSIKIMLHIDRGGDNATSKWWVNGVMGQGVNFDVLGESCYTAYANQGDPANWQANFAQLVTQFPTLSFVVAEYAEDSVDLAGNTECASSTGPCNVWRRANDVAFGIPNKKGLGAFVWEPTEYDETLFDNQNTAKTNDPTNLPNPFATADAGARIQLYDQMATAYGL